MNKYELALVVSAKLEDEARDAVVEKAKGYITRYNGVITEVEEWGKKKLAAHKKRQLEKSVSRKKQPQTQPQNSNRFNNFHQRDYDFAEYEKRLLNNQ